MPASCTFDRMSSMESWIFPETVQLMVEVAGLYSCAPALEMMRPAGTAPRFSAQRNLSYQCCCFSAVSSMSARVRATRVKVPSTQRSTASPTLFFSCYLRCQISSEAGCSGISMRSIDSFLGDVTVLIKDNLLKLQWYIRNTIYSVIVIVMYYMLYIL